jgi:formamidopyrimidine-DNA glycosylase
MPELPDLVHIVKTLGPSVVGRTVIDVSVKNPIVLRIEVPGEFKDLMNGRRFLSLERHGPFLRFATERATPREGQIPPLDVVMHLMLAGRLRLARQGGNALPGTAFSFGLDDGSRLFYGDEKNMGKVYLCETGRFEAIPGYSSQGIDITSPAFTYEAFAALMGKTRTQARVFIMDQSKLSAIGNAYADEILFEARIHPKTPCSSLNEGERRYLFESIGKVMTWGIEEVEKAGRPLEDKVRDHMRVRNRGGEACPRCGSIIRKAGVLGFDSFFCPRCQVDRSGKALVDWNRIPPQ